MATPTTRPLRCWTKVCLVLRSVLPERSVSLSNTTAINLRARRNGPVFRSTSKRASKVLRCECSIFACCHAALTCSAMLHIRSYPVGFGNKIRDLMPQLLSQGEGKPGPAPASFTAVQYIEYCSSRADPGRDDDDGWNWDGWDWPEANLVETLIYLRGSKLLCLPPDVKTVFPRRL